MKRDIRIDVIKTLAMWLVIFYHSPLMDGMEFSHTFDYLSIIKRCVMGICAVGVPLFFCVNGAIAFEKKRDKWVKNVISSMMQYYFWRIIIIITYGLLVAKIDFSKIRIIDFVNCVFFENTIDGINTTYLWFMPVLISMNVILPLFDKIIDERIVKGVCCFLLVSNVMENDIGLFLKLLFPDCLVHFSIINPFRGSIGIYVFYYLCGYLLYSQKERHSQDRLLLILGFIVGCLYNVLRWYANCKVVGYTVDNVISSYDSIGAVIMTLTLFIYINRYCVVNNHILQRIISAIGGGTKGIYYVHDLIIVAYFVTIARLGLYHIGFVHNVIKATVVLLVSAFACCLAKRIPLLNKLVK